MKNFDKIGLKHGSMDLKVKLYTLKLRLSINLNEQKVIIKSDTLTTKICKQLGCIRDKKSMYNLPDINSTFFC